MAAMLSPLLPEVLLQFLPVILIGNSNTTWEIWVSLGSATTMFVVLVQELQISSSNSDSQGSCERQRLSIPATHRGTL